MFSPTTADPVSGPEYVSMCTAVPSVPFTAYTGSVIKVYGMGEFKVSERSGDEEVVDEAVEEGKKNQRKRNQLF